MKAKIGFIGLGIMGRHMAGHLLDAGYELRVYDVSQPALAALVEKGAVAQASCKEVAAVSDIVISMVPDSPDVEKVALGADGIISAAHPGLIYIDMSTIAPGMAVKVSEELGKLGIRCLDAPVSGGETGAVNAALSIMVGGPEDLFREMLPIFEVMGKTIMYCGGSGAGQIVKACNQIQVALNFIGMSEALVLGAKAGVDPAVIIKVLSGGYAQTRVMDVRGPKVIKGEFEPGFKSKFHYKDLNIIMETARRLNVPLPATAVAHELFTAMIASGRGDLDHSAVINIIEDLAKVEARTKG
ncbi:MAG: 2-hydroxy-3-oxopropionate reductase [Anaerolineae bacterium]|nr:2-hydroxy-3-oxopropionate reductase [Anaerolineae bacterium]